MADRKARSFLCKIPGETGLREVKTAIEEITGENTITVFQQTAISEYLVELSDADQARAIIEHGFDLDDHHIDCNPPHGYYLNVSIMGLKAYVDDDAVTEKLSEYGEIKSPIIRLKYKQGHELEGLQNGNRLVRIVLTAPSIPYSIRIGGEWCRIIHNNQQLICTHCNEPGHPGKNCPSIECRLCKSLGHLSFHCPTKITCAETSETALTQETPENTPIQANISKNSTPETPQSQASNNATQMDTLPGKTTDKTPSGIKRQHQTDSDNSNSDNCFKVVLRKSRFKYQPNTSTARRSAKTT